MDNDIRIIILRGLIEKGHTTEQASANDFLATIKTYKDTSDLGTIVEALKELVHLGYIRETRGASYIDYIDTGKKRNWKNPKRFVQAVGDAPKIPDLFLSCSLHGKKFLIEHDKFMIDYTLSRWQERWFWPVAVAGIVSLVISIFSLFSNIE